MSSLGRTLTGARTSPASRPRRRGRRWQFTAVFLALVIAWPVLGAPAAQAVNTSAYSWVRTGGAVQPVAGAMMVVFGNAPWRVLAAGGQYSPGTWIYNPATGKWTAGPAMANPRRDGQGRMTALDDGRVLVAGGDMDENGASLPGTYQLYSPATNKWSSARALPDGLHGSFGLTRISDGRVMLAGGAGGDSPGTGAWLFDPHTNAWVSTGSLHRSGASVTTLLPDGRAFAIGNRLAEVWEPADGEWTEAQAPPTDLWPSVSRVTVLPNGQVMVVGSVASSGHVYDPVTNTWVESTTFPQGSVQLTAAIDKGLVLQIVGNGTSTRFYDTATGAWLAGPDRPNQDDYESSGVLLPSGEFLLGGQESGAPAYSLLLVQNAGPQDTTAPTIEATSPAPDVVVTQGSRLPAEFSCADPAVDGQPTSGVAACEATLTYRDDDDVFVDPVANGDSLDTAMLGWHRLHVTATDEASNSAYRDVTYTVVVPTRVPEATWSGRVLTSDGVPASGVDVSLSALSADGVSVCGRGRVCVASRTDAQGRFSLTVEARTEANPIDYVLRLDRVAGSEARAGEVVLPLFGLGQGTVSDLVADRSQDITLPPLRMVTARVEDSAGDPLVGAVVRLPEVDQADEPPMTNLLWSPAAAGSESATTRTDASGESVFYTFGSTTPLYVEALFHGGDGQVFSAFRSVTVGDADATVVLRQPDAVTWSGQVLTSGGVPVSGVDVSATALAQDGRPVGGLGSQGAMARTDADGRFAVTVEARSGDNPVDYRTVISRAVGARARAGEAVLPVFSVGLGTVTDFMSDRTQNITLPSLVKVTVHTVDDAGDAAAGVEVFLPGVDQSDEPPMSALYWTPAATDESATTRTDAHGEATFYSISSPVPLVVEARFPGSGRGTVSSFRTVVAETGDTELTIRAPQTATLSGRVLTTEGVPAAGVDVSLSPLSGDGWPLCGHDEVCAVSRTDAQGRYALTVEARSADNPVDYTLGVDRAAGAQARAGDVVLPVFHVGQGAVTDLVGDRTQDITLPALVKVTTHVQDARGKAVRGEKLLLGTVDPSDEPPMSALYWSPAPDSGESAATVTDASGDAVFYSFGSSTPLQVQAVFATDGGTVNIYRALVADTDATLTIQAPDGFFGEADTDAVSDAVEDKVPSLSGSGTGDGNGDGVPDSQQPNVASVPGYGTSDDYVTIATQQGTGLAHVVAVDPGSVPAPAADVPLPKTLTSFTVTDIPAGALDQTVSIYVDSTAGIEGYAKYDEQTGWGLLPDDRFTIVDAHRIDITLTDGGVGDADGAVNGSIDDPGGPVWGSVSAGTPTVSDTTPNVGEHVSVDEGTWGEGVRFTYQWLRTAPARATIEIPGATAREYAVTADDLGSTLQVRVTGSSTGHLATTRTSAATSRVKIGALSSTPTPSLDDTTPVTDQKLTANPAGWSPDGVRLEYRWYRRSPSGKVKSISGATSISYTAAASDVGYRLRVRVTGSLSGYAPVAKYSAWTSKVAKAPFTTVPAPSVPGVVRVGIPLTTVPGGWEPTATVKYRWYRLSSTGSSSAIAGATRATYTPTSTDKGKRLKVRVTGSRPGYVTTSRDSEPTTPVQPGMVAATPRITGTPTVDQELTADEGAWTPSQPETTFSYQWYAKSTSGKVYKISGATNRTYKAEGRYAGYKLKVAVTGTATDYAPVTTASGYTARIAKAASTTGP